jgi:(p)ppGpp synthase/HD superfamily hydrolase
VYNPDRYVEALEFAADAHAGQTVPGSRLPYVVHVVSVAGEVIAALARESVDKPELAVLCALLHDTVEDTPRTREDIARTFGEEVAAGVDALSKRSELPKEQRMGDSLERIVACPREVAWVKLADRIVNLSEPPHYWTNEKRQAYQAEAGVILARLGHASVTLSERLRARIAEYGKYIG